MSRNSPAEQATMRADIGREVERASKAVSNHLDGVVGNARWFTTLVLAEVAGISKFTETAVGRPFALVVISVSLLALSAFALIRSITKAQRLKAQVERATVGLLLDLPSKDLSDTTPQDISSVLSTVKTVLAVTEEDTEHQAHSTIGLWLFFVGSFFGGVALFVV